jgi:Type II secretion system (T2SS), protein M subtype b
MTISEHVSLARAAAVAILLVLLAAAWLGPVALYENLRAADAEALAAAAETLARDRAIVAAKDERPGDASILLPAMSDADAAAFLQETMKHAAQAADIEIEGIEVLPADTLAGAARVALRLRARGAIGGIARLLYAVSVSRPLLYPDNLHIAAHGTTPGAGSGLDFEFDVSAFKAGASS